MGERAFLTFDCYGTLIDWETGIWRACREMAGEVGVAVDRERVLRLYAEIEPRVEAESFRSYREVLTETARRLFARLGHELSAERAAFLPRSLAAWPAFPDTRAALERLAEDHRLGILSNVDDDLLAATLEPLGVGFELLVTAERVRSYKPAEGHFARAREAIGSAPWTHVAQSLFHDIAPAKRLGIPAAWINRQGERPPAGLQPDAEYPDLRTFAAARAPRRL